jgi:hypothetical protein
VFYNLDHEGEGKQGWPAPNEPFHGTPNDGLVFPKRVTTQFNDTDMRPAEHAASVPKLNQYTCSLPDLLGILESPPSQELQAYEVPRSVNKASVDEPGIIDRADLKTTVVVNT